MSALDRFHEVVRNALVKDGWIITHDPLTVTVNEDRVFIDLGAERLLAATRGSQKIAVEIKTFIGSSRIADLEGAVGQYIVYRMALRRVDPERLLYLAVPQPILANLFQNRELWRAFLVDEGGKIFGYDVDNEEIVQWEPLP
jgi:hypothetical protein